MKLSIFLMLFATQCYSSRTEPTTLRIEERIEILKAQIRNSLRHPQEPDPIPAIYDESDEDGLIPPVLDNDAVKRDAKYWLKTIIAAKAPPPALRTMSTTKITTGSLLTSKQPVTKVEAQEATGTSFDIFYRKSFAYLNTPLEWVHCTDLVSPFITGAKKELTQPRKLHANHPIVQRLIHLLAQNVSGFIKMEKRSLMYQASKLNIRMFTWDFYAMDALMNVIMAADPDQPSVSPHQNPTFARLKIGLETIFKQWSIDLSNTTTLLLQAKMFRPPCLQPFQEGEGIHSGSSKFVRGSTVPSPATSPKSNEDRCLYRASGDNKDCR